MRINGYVGVSLIEFPDKISSVIYTSPCNFRCPFCHNPGLIKINNSTFAEEFVLNDLKERRQFIDGICITGGEPLLQEDLYEFLKKIKNLGLLVKIDTNGYLTEKVQFLLNEKLVDFISMDIKTSIEKYEVGCGIKIEKEKILNSIDIIMNSNIDYEFRTTVVPGIVEEEDFFKIGKMIKGAKLYSLQQFENTITYDKNFRNIQPYLENDIKRFAQIMKKFVKKVKIKNIAVSI